MSTPVEQIAEWLPRENIPRGFIVSEGRDTACIVTPEMAGHLKFLVMCDDCYYGLEQHVPLGQFLADLGLTADDCARAIEDWRSLGPQPS